MVTICLFGFCGASLSHWIMMFVVCDERVFTERKNRLAGIPEGKGIWAPCASYTSYWGTVDFDFKQKVFRWGLHVFFPLFYGFNPNCCVFISQLYNLKHIKSSRKDINMFLMAAGSHFRNLFRSTWFKINSSYLVGVFCHLTDPFITWSYNNLFLPHKESPCSIFTVFFELLYIFQGNRHKLNANVYINHQK